MQVNTNISQIVVRDYHDDGTHYDSFDFIETTEFSYLTNQHPDNQAHGLPQDVRPTTRMNIIIRDHRGRFMSYKKIGHYNLESSVANLPAC